MQGATAGIEVLRDVNKTKHVRAKVHAHVKAAAERLGTGASLARTAAGHLHNHTKTVAKHLTVATAAVTGVPGNVADDVVEDLSTSLFASMVGLSGMALVVVAWACLRACRSCCHCRRGPRYQPLRRAPPRVAADDDDFDDCGPVNSIAGARSAAVHTAAEEDDMVGFDDLLDEVLRDAKAEDARVQEQAAAQPGKVYAL